MDRVGQHVYIVCSMRVAQATHEATLTPVHQHPEICIVRLLPEMEGEFRSVDALQVKCDPQLSAVLKVHGSNLILRLEHVILHAQMQRGRCVGAVAVARQALHVVLVVAALLRDQRHQAGLFVPSIRPIVGVTRKRSN